MKYKFIVWVGAVDNYHTKYREAIQEANDWIAKGYDDVKIEIINWRES